MLLIVQAEVRAFFHVLLIAYNILNQTPVYKILNQTLVYTY